MLTASQSRFLRSRAHPLKPVVLIGQKGLTDAVFAAIEEALHHHELIKLQLSLGDRQLRDQAIAEILTRSGAEQVQRIGNRLVLYRANPEQAVLKLPAGG